MKDSIGLDFFTKLLYASHLKIKDDHFYCIGKRAVLESNTYESDIYRLDAGGIMPMTSSHDVQDYALLADGIVFASARTAKDKEAIAAGEPLTVFQRLPYHGGEAIERLRLPYQIIEAHWLSDGKLLFRGCYDHMLQSFVSEYDGDMQKAIKTKKEQGDLLTIFDELPFWFNGEGIINKQRTGLYLYDGTNVRLLSDPLASVDRLVLNDAGTRALFSQILYEHVMPQDNTLCLLDIPTVSITSVDGVARGTVEDYAFGPNETVLYLLNPADSPYGRNAGNPSLYRVPLAGGKPTLLEGSGQYNYHNSVGSDAKLGNVHSGLHVVGNAVYFLCTLRHNCHILRLDLNSGEVKQITQTEGMVQEFVPHHTGEFAMLAMRDDMPGSLYIVNEQGAERCIVDCNAEVMATHEVVTPIPLSFVNASGDEITGWVMPPVGYVPGMVYPAILNIHGGPKTAYGSVLFHEMQYWCAQGYAVLFCNPTGSDGGGSAFADIRGRYGTVDYEDIMRFVDVAIERYGFISAVRLGVTGGSYGGFMTNWIIGHTDRFRAAASQRSISNWVGFANTSDIGYTFGKDQMQATPWTDVEAMWRASPLKYADNVSTPTLFIHSEEDYRCNMFEGIQMYYALRHFDIDTRMCLFKGENHELSRSGKPKARIRRLQEITRWMDKYLKLP